MPSKRDGGEPAQPKNDRLFDARAVPFLYRKDLLLAQTSPAYRFLTRTYLAALGAMVCTGVLLLAWLAFEAFGLAEVRGLLAVILINTWVVSLVVVATAKQLRPGHAITAGERA